MPAGDRGVEAGAASGGSSRQPEQRQEQRAGGTGEQQQMTGCSKVEASAKAVV